jgi:hypothetical protein
LSDILELFCRCLADKFLFTHPARSLLCKLPNLSGHGRILSVQPERGL